MSRRTQVPRPCRQARFAYGAFTLSGRPSQDRFATSALYDCTGQAPPRPYNPAAPRDAGLGSSPFARRYWGNLV